MKKEAWRWVERGITLVAFLTVLTGWIISATINKTKAEADMNYLKAELAEVKVELREVKGTVTDTNDKVDENAKNLDSATTLLEYILK